MANVNLLQTASLASMQPLTISGQLVINSYWQIKDELRTLGPQHAALLSEPTLNSQLGEVDWTSDLPGTPARLTALQGEDRKAAEDTLAKLCADVEHHINQLDATGDTAKLQRAKALKLALEVVSESDIFVADGQPVLTNWGHLPTGPSAIRQYLWKFVEQIRGRQHEEALQANAITQNSTIGVSQGGYSHHPTMEAELRATPLGSTDTHNGGMQALFWLSFIGFSTLIGMLLLQHCALGWPSLSNALGGTAFGYCPTRSAAGQPPAAAGRTAALQGELSRLKRQLALKRQTCQRLEPRPAGPRTTTKQERDRVKQLGGKIGSVNVILSWQANDDLDIYVKCKEGQIGYGNKSDYGKAAGCKGKLDVDANSNPRTMSATPVENIVWGRNKANKGQYKIFVARYSDRSPKTPSTAYSVRLLVDGKCVRQIVGEVRGTKKKQHVLDFELPYSPKPGDGCRN